MDKIENLELPLFPISTAAKMLNVSVHTLRMYEREGLILPFKKESKHRLYSHSDIERLNCIRSSINEKKIGIQGIKTIYSLIPCWQIVNCSQNDRENCEAYSSHSRPCWTYVHKDNICANLDCRECNVYKNYAECKNLKEKLRTVIK